MLLSGPNSKLFESQVRPSPPPLPPTLPSEYKAAQRF